MVKRLFIVVTAALFTVVSAGEIPEGLLEKKRALAAKHDYQMKKPVVEKEKRMRDSSAFSKEELEMEKALAVPSGSSIDEDKVEIQMKSRGEEGEDAKH